jgi:hypothetical protein
MALVLLTAGCGRGQENGEPPAHGVALVVCEEDGSTAVTKRVQAGRDGIDIEVVYKANAAESFIRTTADQGQNLGGRLKRTGITEVTTTLPPGELLIAASIYPATFLTAITQAALQR